ncbi:hypothetical protein D5086_018349 [Populus alba]|uniref:Uncharacterized protein n=3 Tax=Populus TaxID=3689 RepID=A0ACC4BPG8_POPAL|nr:uncharacterized protein LOC118059217 [Populus alba]KAJ6985332.1 hypothetical protein NC653_023333 [Populus alba x Populus x berolinensis]TKS05240.1 uncharacterized protein D5086_0000133370 [Populus alba]
MSIQSRSLPPPRNPRPAMLNKQLSWSPDMTREEIWLRRKGNSATRRRCSKSVTDDDLEELRACIELGFGFGPDSSDLDPKLSDTLPALGFYCALNKQYSSCLSRSASTSSLLSVSGDDPEMVKKRLRRWAQIVACSVKQFSGERPN